MDRFMFLIFLMFMAYAMVGDSSAQTISSITFEQVERNFGSKSSLTELQKDQHWKRYKGACVKWTGKLVHVQEGWLGGITLGFQHQPATFTYDVLLSAPSSYKDIALSMQKNNYCEYTATLKNYGGPILPITADAGC